MLTVVQLNVEDRVVSVEIEVEVKAAGNSFSRFLVVNLDI
jgi:hypothetical protein